MLWGSCFIQLRKCKASIMSFPAPALPKQLRTEGSTFEPPKEANSPKTRGIWMQSCKRRPSLRSVARRCWSAMSRNMSVRKQFLDMRSSIECQWRPMLAPLGSKITKGQQNWKQNCRAADSPKKMNKRICFSILNSSQDKNLFVRFLGESATQQFCFQIY